MIFDWFVRGRSCDIFVFRARNNLWYLNIGTMQNLWYLTFSYYAEFMIFDMLVRARSCDIFVFRVMNNVWYFPSPCEKRNNVIWCFPNKEDDVCIKLEESPLVLFIYSNQKVNIHYHLTSTRIISLYIINFIFHVLSQS